MQLHRSNNLVLTTAKSSDNGGYYMRVVRFQTPWLLIAVCFILFWPLGVILLIKRLAVDRSAAITCGKSLNVIAYILTGVSCVYLFLMIFMKSSFITSFSTHATFLIIGSMLLIFLAHRTEATGERYKKYIDLIINRSETSIDYIASDVGVTNFKAVSDLKAMIDIGYLPGAFVNVPGQRVHLPGSTPAMDPVPASNVFQPPQPSPQQPPTAVTCKSCGANNKMTPGHLAECDYCGSHL